MKKKLLIKGQEFFLKMNYFTNVFLRVLSMFFNISCDCVDQRKTGEQLSEAPQRFLLTKQKNKRLARVQVRDML